MKPWKNERSRVNFARHDLDVSGRRTREKGNRLGQVGRERVKNCGQEREGERVSERAEPRGGARKEEGEREREREWRW